MTDHHKKMQMEICSKYDALFTPSRPNLMLGISDNVRGGTKPINGLRHSKTENTTGWYIWAGEQFSEDDDFFKPLHVSHLDDWCSQVIPYLGLPPGWRFLIADEYEDVWFDECLLSS